MLKKGGIPVVVLDRHFPNYQVDSVRGDSVGGAFELTNHLLELGHRRIAIITGRQDHSTASDRVAGALRAFEQAGIGEPPLVYWSDYNQDSGYLSTQKALSEEPRLTAIFGANNFIAIGAMRALRDAGVRVPEDMSVVAFDDLPPAITIDPFFTVAAQPAYEMGRQATELLLSRLSDEGPDDPQEIVLPVEIIVRKSSGKPPLLK